MTEFFAALSSDAGSTIVGIFNASPPGDLSEFFLTNTAYIDESRKNNFIPLIRDRGGIMYAGDLNLSSQTIDVGRAITPVFTVFSSTPIVNPNSTVRIAFANGDERVFGGEQTPYIIVRYAIVSYGTYVLTSNRGFEGNTLTSVQVFLSFIADRSALANSIRTLLLPLIDFR